MDGNTTLPTFSDDEASSAPKGSRLAAVAKTNSVVNSVISDITATELPGAVANSTMLEKSSPKSPPPKKKRQMRNFHNGKINVKDRRTGRDASDAFYHRKNSIKQAAINLHRITGAAVEITIKPLTDKSNAITYYKSPNFDNFMPKQLRKKQSNVDLIATAARESTTDDDNDEDDNDDDDAGTDFERNAADAVQSTPTKRLGSRKSSAAPEDRTGPSVVPKKNVCQVCKVVYGSDEDVEINCRWLGCGVKRCTFYVHSKCVFIHYYNHDKKLDKQTESWCVEHFFCPDHRPDEDKEKRQKKIAPKGSRLSAVAKAAMSQKK